MTLSVQITHRQGDFALDAAFSLESGLTALFGPSGSGKTSIINIIAGLVRPDHARITFGDEVWNDTDKRIVLPAHRRRIGYAFQDGRLFPHLSVRSNLLYGARFLAATERTVDLGKTVDLLGIGHLLDRRPAMLSGGEKQRVALGRTLLSCPKLLLMDEPLSALDSQRKAEILPDIERIRDEAGVPILYVSHAIGEVARLATHVIAMKNGRIVASGRPGAVLAADAVLSGGLPAGSFMEAVVERHMPDYGLTTARSQAGFLYLRHVAVAEGSRVRLRIAASDVMLATARPESISALNVLEGRIQTMEPDSQAGVTVTVDCAGEPLIARLTRYSAENLALKPGMPIYALFKAVSIDSDDLFRAGV